jgi:hypothetical protein
MIPAFVVAWDERKSEIEAKWRKGHPKTYKSLVEAVVSILTETECGYGPDPDCITEIDTGDCQGVLVYVIAGKSYQSREHWCVRVKYGSCSGCDTLEGIRDCEEGGQQPSEQQVQDYMTLSLHILQSLHEIEGEIV